MQDANGKDTGFSMDDRVKVQIPRDKHDGYIGKIVKINGSICWIELEKEFNANWPDSMTIIMDFVELVHYEDSKVRDILAKLREESTTNELSEFIPWAIYKAHAMYREEKTITKTEFAELVDLIITF